MSYTSPEKRVSNPQGIGLWSLFLSPLLTPSHGRRSGYLLRDIWKRSCITLVCPLDLLTFKRVLWLSPGMLTGHIGRPVDGQQHPWLGGQAYPIPDFKGRCWQANWGEPFKPHLPKQVRSVIELTFSPSVQYRPFIQFWTWNVGGWTTEIFIDPLDSTDAQLILYCMWYTNQWTPMVCLLYAKLLKAVYNFEKIKSISQIDWNSLKEVNLHERWSQPKMACKGYVMWDRLQLCHEFRAMRCCSRLIILKVRFSPATVYNIWQCVSLYKETKNF